MSWTKPVRTRVFHGCETRTRGSLLSPWTFLRVGSVGVSTFETLRFGSDRKEHPYGCLALAWIQYEGLFTIQNRASCGAEIIMDRSVILPCGEHPTARLGSTEPDRAEPQRRAPYNLGTYNISRVVILRTSRAHRARRKGTSDNVQRTRYNLNGLTEKLKQKRYNRQDTTDKVQHERSNRIRPTEKVPQERYNTNGPTEKVQFTAPPGLRPTQDPGSHSPGR